MSRAVVTEKLPIDEKTIWSVVYVLPVKRRIESVPWRASAAFVPRMLWPSSEPSKIMSSKVSKIMSEGESL